MIRYKILGALAFTAIAFAYPSHCVAQASVNILSPPGSYAFNTPQSIPLQVQVGWSGGSAPTQVKFWLEQNGIPSTKYGLTTVNWTPTTNPSLYAGNLVAPASMPVGGYTLYFEVWRSGSKIGSGTKSPLYCSGHP